MYIKNHLGSIDCLVSSRQRPREEATAQLVLSKERVEKPKSDIAIVKAIEELCLRSSGP